MFYLLFPLQLQIKKLRSEILETFFRDFLQLTIITKRSTLGAAAALDPPLLRILTYQNATPFNPEKKHVSVHGHNPVKRTVR